MNKVLNQEEVHKIMTDKYPNLSDSFLTKNESHYDLFARKHLSYGMNNITLGEDVSTEEGKQIALTGITIRLIDKLNRLKNLIILQNANTVEDESIKDTFQDISNYGVIAQMVMDGTWKKG